MKVKVRSEYTVITTGMIRPGLLGGALVEFLAEARNVHAVLTQCRTNRRRRIRLAGRHLQLDVASYFLCHGNGTS